MFCKWYLLHLDVDLLYTSNYVHMLTSTRTDLELF